MVAASQMTQLSSPSRGDPDARPASSSGFRRAPRSRTRLTGSSGIDELAIAVVLATMPLTYIGVRFGGLQLSGWAWPVSLAVALAALATRPLNHKSVGYLAPYLLFLAIALMSLLYTPVFFEGLLTFAQTAAPAMAYVIAFRTPLDNHMRNRSLHLLAFAYGTMAALLLIVGLPVQGTAPISYTGLVEGVWVAARPLSINMVVAFLLVNALARSRRVVVGAGVLGLVVSVGTGSRMATAVLLLVFWASPRVLASWRTRIATLLIGAAALPLVLSLPAVQDRFFFGDSGGSVQDVLTLAPNMDTAGRRELWPALLSYVADRPLTGYGIGASYELSRLASGGLVTHPHNDFIRTLCDTGVIGSVGVWWFVVAAGVRNLVRLRARRQDRVAASALFVVIGFLLLATSDNPLVYPAQFTLPAFVLLAWADQSNGTAAAAGRTHHPA
jgi:O-antigen ligase